MMRFRAMITRVIKELIRDKRTLALMLIAPVIVLSLMNVVFDSNENTHVKIGIDQSVPKQVVDNFPSDKSKIKTYDDKDINIKETIRKDNLDAFIKLEGHTFHITYENEDPTSTAQIKAMFQSLLTADKMQEMGKELQKFSTQTGTPPNLTDYSVKSNYIYGNADSSFFDKIYPILIGFFVFFFVFLISGIALLRERTNGTLERLLATPIKRSEIVMGYLVSYGLFAILQTLIIVFFAMYILKLEIVGSLLLVIGTNILVALTALSMGIFVSTFASSEFQMVQFIPLIVIPQVFFSGLIPLDTMAGWVRGLSYIFPLSYAGKALTNVMEKGYSLQDIGIELLALVGFILLFTVLNIVGLKRYRKV